MIKLILMEVNKNINKRVQKYVQIYRCVRFNIFEVFKIRIRKSFHIRIKSDEKRKRGYMHQDRSILVSLLFQNVHFNLFNSVICDFSNPPYHPTGVTLSF